jgi:dienelactone hydrolase
MAHVQSSVSIAFTLAFGLALIQAGPARAEAVTLKARDGVEVSATFEGGPGDGRPIVLLFHQAGGSGAEYDAIAPRIRKLGFDTLAVDQRSGGSGFGRANRTVQRLGRSSGYLSALPDLQAAVDWAAARHAPGIIAWGSSYSASLVFLLAERETRLAAVISFSPGEYFDDPGLVRRAASNVRVPVLVSSASTPDEIAAAAAIVAAIPGGTAVQIRPRQAVHGSIALASPGGNDVWPAVEQFLSAHGRQKP